MEDTATSPDGQEQECEMLAAALDYGERGWPVFPAPRGTKKSHKSAEHSGGRPWGSTLDPDKIRYDREKWPDANIGVVTGRQAGLFVVDLDTENGHGTDGLGSFYHLVDVFGLPETVKAETPSGGQHLYFKAPADFQVKSTSGRFLPGVDIRGEGGMVLAAPSVKPGVGVYKWINPPGTCPVAEAPEWLLDEVRKTSSRKERTLAETIGNSHGASGVTLAEAEDALTWIDPDCSYDPWNEILMAVHDEFGTDGIALADEWSARAPHRYQEGLVEQKFASFTPGHGVTIKTLFDRAQKGGCDLGQLRAKHIADRFFAPVPAAEPLIFETLSQQKRHAECAASPAQFPADPVDLWGRFDPPALPMGVLPPVIEEFARVQGAVMGADPAGLAVAALVTCAAAISDNITIQPKQHDKDWLEAPRIWAALVGNPSTKKSPILSAATRPLCGLDARLFRQWEVAHAEWSALPRAEQKNRPEPRQRRLRLGDTTVEAAQSVLANSPDGVLLLQDELSGWFGAMDKYNGGKGAAADRGVWLQAFNGGPYALNRKTSGSALIPNLSVCLLGGIQPEPIRKIASDSHDDGLLQRLFPIVLRPASEDMDTPVPDAAGRYHALVAALHRLAKMGGPLTFDAGARHTRERLVRKHRELQSVEFVSPKLATHIGKYDGLFARLCLIWHCIENADAHALPGAVSADTADRVAVFLHDFLLRQAFAFYSGVLALSEDHGELAAIAGFILAAGPEKDRIAYRDIQRGTRSMKNLKEAQARPLLEQLVALGWLEKVDGPRMAPHWLVNPRVHVLFANRARAEEARRAEARRILTSLGRDEATADSPAANEGEGIFG